MNEKRNVITHKIKQRRHQSTIIHFHDDVAVDTISATNNTPNVKLIHTVSCHQSIAMPL
jgi:hypothetical protein